MRRPNPLAKLPKFHRGAFVLFALAIVTTAVLADQPLAAQLVLQPGAFTSGQGLWQPLSANFMFPEGKVAGILGTVAVQWLLAGALEAFWGTRRYVLLALGCGVAGYLVTGLLAFVIPAIGPVAMGGATAMDLAAVVAYGVVFGKRPLHIGGFLPLSSRGLAIAIAVIAVLSPIARGGPWPVVLPWVVSMLTALVITTQPWRRLGNSGKLGGRKRRKASHLKVVRPERKLLN